MSFRILVANRGECAVRLLYTLAKMDIYGIGVYVKEDASCRHVQMAPEGVEVANYADIAGLVRAAKQCGAQAIIPGWGFKSEDPRFPKACAKAGIIFCGPSEQTMKQAGDKDKAKKLARKKEIPVILGSFMTAKGGKLEKWAERHGLTDGEDSIAFMLKAVAGGGGTGNEIILRLSDLPDRVNNLKARAKRYWDSEKLFLEQLIRGARHIEVQFARDRHGNFVHFGTRDCSLQWNFQKVIETAPAPDCAQEEDLFSYTWLLADELAYCGVGTVEFLVSPEGNAYFLEINPRLQVEHGVTELICGIDLVEVLVRISMGEPLGLKQEDVQFTGFAAEARVNTQTVNLQDPAQPMATNGKVEQFCFPKGVRVDHALSVGYEPSLDYNSTQAKIIVRGETYEQAIRALHEALGKTKIAGIKTNIPLLRSILQDDSVRIGKHTVETMPAAVLKFAKRIVRKKEEKKEDTSLSKEMAAVIGASLAFAMRQNSYASQGEAGTYSAWRDFGRRAQMRILFR